ncbi:hypothetical protein EHQ53_13885 [Leptospira langatensis]|uniref:Cytochrome C Planctomycete-type domain-containing protein n=1 Tax=Leptospira langatensis TaxID=2484983 RepID=A0A5F1ZRF7_9LEPT|nr:hypothetical protein [Leptospira langatensis]TGK02548.1 hypothetical protein EHO57_04230 [Leptospira langatensis]TGL40251.1 hypothetical protein EHQ53_13885 [Leptospira langatensis]
MNRKYFGTQSLPKQARYGIFALLLAFSSASSFFCENSSKKPDPAFNLVTANMTLPTYTCTSVPSFADLTSTPGFSSCQGCHGASAHGGVNLTDYNSTKADTVPGQPHQSRLFQTLFGIMAGYTNNSVKQAVYCWIQGGSSP